MCCGNMENCSQATFEFMLMLGAVLLVVGAIVSLIGLIAQGLSSSVGDQIDNVRDNVLIPSLVGANIILFPKDGDFLKVKFFGEIFDRS